MKYPEIIRSYSTEFESGHGRLERRDISVIATDYTELNFAGIQQICLLKRYRESFRTGKVEEETVFLITDLSSEQATPKRLLELKREYWHIENKLHYIKDNVFGEDRSTIRLENGPRNMSALRNFAVSLYQALGVPNIKRFVDNIRYSNLQFLNMLWQL